MKFFVTTVSGWDSLAVVTQKSVFVPKSVLDLLGIRMSKNELSIISVEENFTK